MNTETPDASILVVDDDANNRDMLSRRLARRGFQVAVVEDGRKAIQAIAEGHFDLVVLDVMMPGLSGFDVLKEVRGHTPPAVLPIIMATARDQSEDVVQALEAGANDYITKPIDFPVALARIQTQIAMKRAIEQVRALEQSLADRNRELESANDRLSAVNSRMRRDLRSAAKVQEATLPGVAPRYDEAAFAWAFRPCDELAGDGLNVVSLDEHQVGLYVLDVSGHGVASALLSVALSRALAPVVDASSVLHHAATGASPTRVVSPAGVADQLNKRYAFDMATEQYFTIVYGILDLRTGLFRYVCAGHPGPVHLPRDGPSAILEYPGFPIGFADEPYVEHALMLDPGDRLVLYSDGVPEAFNAAREQFGGDRLVATLDRARALPLEQVPGALLDDVTAWCGRRFRDDVTILVLEYFGPKA